MYYWSKVIKIKTITYRTTTRAKTEKGIFLDVLFNKSEIFADRALSVAGPREWNSLLDDIRSCDRRGVFIKKMSILTVFIMHNYFISQRVLMYFL